MPRAVRKSMDAYMTPRWQTEALLQHQPLGEAPTIFECCSGDLSIVHALPTLEPMAPEHVWTNDLDVARTADYHLDAAQPDVWDHLTHNQGGFDWTVTNSPFQQPTQLHILQHARRTSRIGVAMIARLSFLEPVEKFGRGVYLKASPPDRIIVLERWSYTNDGNTDSVTTAWMIWFNDPMWQRWALTVPPIVCAYGAKVTV